MAEDASNLSDYLKQQRNNTICWCVEVPDELVKEVNASVVAGSRQWAAMRRWLGDRGYPIMEGRFDGHFRKGHHLV